MMNTNKSPLRKLAKYLSVLPLALLLITANSVYAQTNKMQKEIMPPQEPQKKESKNNEIFVVVEEQPEFPGGTSALMKFIGDNIKYPVEAQKKDIDGRVITNFIVEKDGSLSNISIVEGVHPLLDAEAVRMISTMPKWKAGKQRGVKVRVKYTLPVVFRLVSKDKDSTVVPDESSDDLFVVVEKQPEFPGGMQALMEFIGDSIRYPKESIENGIQGRVITNFIIHKDGSISDINITEGIDPLLDAEAIRMISTMPKWKPGMQRGKAVNVRYTLPVVYRLQK